MPAHDSSEQPPINCIIRNLFAFRAALVGEEISSKVKRTSKRASNYTICYIYYCIIYITEKVMRNFFTVIESGYTSVNY